jgi:hypothetical protein
MSYTCHGVNYPLKKAKNLEMIEVVHAQLDGFKIGVAKSRNLRSVPLESDLHY